MYFQCLVPVHKPDFKPLAGVCMHEIHCIFFFTIMTIRQATSAMVVNSAPTVRPGHVDGDQKVRDDDRPGTQKTDARYNLRCDASCADIDMS